ncbi:hypothetical protein OAX32_03070 [Flavobacteriales bacterium]|nr:hypothetical protein [Flavobacteriales bacterium]
MKNLIICLFITLSINMSAVDLFVYPGASSPDFSSIATAVDSASDGDRILVASGSYSGDINIIAKSISILPTVSSNSITIQGDIIVNTDSSVSTKNITISSVEIIGDIKHESLYNLETTPYTINFINCSVFGEFNLNADNIITNIYYSNFHKSVYLNASLEIVGNIFESSSSTMDTVSITNGLWSNGSTLLNSEVKFYANKLNDYQFKCDLTSSNIITKIHIANNYMRKSISSTIAILDLNDPTITCLIENNTLRFYSQNYYQQNSGDILRSTQGMLLLTIRNNLILGDYWIGNSNYAYGAFYFATSARNTIFRMENNFFNYGNSLFSGSPYIYGIPYSSLIANNISSNLYSLSNGSLIVNDSTGIPSAGVLSLTENSGKDIMECRDIDDTQNDVGPLGGPHSWINYHQNSVGTARVIDIDINSSINSITNGSLIIKAKSINTNQ